MGSVAFETPPAIDLASPPPLKAFSGGGDARSMAGGVSKATLPTMAGMVSALSGVLAMIWVKNQVETNELLMGEYVSGHSKQGARK